jgi:hypothetical protein
MDNPCWGTRWRSNRFSRSGRRGPPRRGGPITVPRSVPTDRNANERGARELRPLRPLLETTLDQVSVRPSFARSVAPSDSVTPGEPTTSAFTIRGDSPPQ